MNKPFDLEDRAKKPIQHVKHLPVDTKTRFWNLVDEYQIGGHKLGQILNAPIKQILFWGDTEFPEDAIKKLEDFLNVDRSSEVNDPRN